MKHVYTVVALAAALTAPAWAQNLAIVNGKPVPLARVSALQQQVERSGRPVDEAMLAQLKEEIERQIAKGTAVPQLGGSFTTARATLP